MNDTSTFSVTSQTGKFAIVPVWVLQQGLTGSELAVYVSLRSFADATSGEAFPRQKLIADRAGVNPRTVARAIARLRELDLIRTSQRKRDDGSIAGCDYFLRDVPPNSAVSLPPDEDVTTPPDEADSTPLTRLSYQEQTSGTDQIELTTMGSDDAAGSLFDAPQPQPKPQRKKSKTPLPQSWRPTTEHHQRAQASGIDVNREADKFRLHAEMNDRRVVEWNAAFTQWLIKAEEFQQQYAPARADDRVPNFWKSALGAR